MGRKPVEQRKIWSAIRFLRRFTLEDLSITTEATYARCDKFVRQLFLAGHVRIVGQDPGPGQRITYLLVRNTGPLPPSVTDESLYDPNTKRTYQYKCLDKKSGRDSAWQLMREAQDFTCLEVSQKSGCSMANLHKYVRALLVGGYLEVVNPATPGPYATPAVYRLIRDTGDLAPVVQRDGSLVDPNLTIDGDGRDE